MRLTTLLLASLPLWAEAPPALRLVEWERGVAVEPRAHPDRTMFLWFYEWNMFEAMSPGEHTQGNWKLARRVGPDGGSAVVTGSGLRLEMKVVPDGAELSVEVTNLSGHDWPELAAIIPCWNPGQQPGADPTKRAPLNVIFADDGRDKTFFVSGRGLETLDSRAIHFHQQFRPLLDRLSPQGKFVFSNKWPTSEVNAATGILIRESADQAWVTGIGWEDCLSVQGHNPWACMHASVRVGPLKRGEKKTVRGRVYLFPGSRNDCLKRWRQAFPAASRDLSFFLRRLRTLDHLPELEDSHTAMPSTWDRSGGN